MWKDAGDNENTSTFIAGVLKVHIKYKKYLHSFDQHKF
jgi:hypothetical protein